ncbi:MAG: hypothetical protein QW042_05035 [Thermoplasmata archaeon]
MKKLLKKLKESWLDYLIIFISVGAICFVYLFTAFYQPKENKQNLNKENIVKVLSKKEPFENNLFSTGDSVFTLGSIKDEYNYAEIIYFMNIYNVEIITYPGGTPNTQEYEIIFDTYIYSRAYRDFTNIYATSSNMEYQFSVYTDETTSILQFMNIGINYFNVGINNVALDDIETFEINYDLYFDIYIEIDDYIDDVIYENEISFEINNETISYNIFFSNDNAPNYVSSFQELVTGNTLVRYIPGGLVIPIEYEKGYQDGYNDGVTETEDYYEELIIPDIKEEYEEIGYNNGYDYGLEIGYNNGYNDGVIAGSNNFNILNLIRSLFDLVWDALNVEMLPNIKLIYIVSIPLILSVIKFILGWFR